MVVTISKAIATMTITHLSFIPTICVSLFSLLFFLFFISMLAVVNDINSAKVKNLDS